MAKADAQDAQLGKRRKPDWWATFRRRQQAGYLLKYARDVIAGKLGMSEPAPLCSFSVCSIDTAKVSDGAVLRGSLLLPKGLGAGPFPAVLMRTPYGRKGEFGQSFLAQQGYAVIVQDTRGRFSSDGQFVPVQHERDDGPATIAWIRQQPWCNGRVGVTGISYLGFTAWACVDGIDVDAIVPVVTQSSVRSAVFRPGGAVSYELVVLWFYLVLHLMKDMQTQPISFFQKSWQGLWNGTLKRAYKALPISKVDEVILGSRNDFLQSGLAAHDNPESDFWEDKDRLCQFEKAVPPCHILTGWYDFFLDGALRDYVAARYGQSNTRLIVGPFHHWSLVGSIKTYHKVLLDCFDAHLKDLPGTPVAASEDQEKETDYSLTPVPTAAANEIDADASSNRDKKFGRATPKTVPHRIICPVSLYIMGFGWRDYPSYPPPFRAQTWHLGSEFKLVPGTEGAISSPLEHKYHYNPAKPTPSLGGPSFNPLNAGPRDQQKIEDRDDVLVYSSSLLEAPLLIAGPVQLHLQARWETDRADFVGRLCHVDRRGRSTNLCEGLGTVKASKAGGKLNAGQNVTIDMSATAVMLRPGERLRLQVCSAAHPRWFRNLGTREHLAEAKSFVAGDVHLLHGQLVVPLDELHHMEAAHAGPYDHNSWELEDELSSEPDGNDSHSDTESLDIDTEQYHVHQSRL
eukprot:TRINITY_DN14334_c0_g1_i1.p1 TRINITY_DN14334_c0_g1~~TRINITY_DN14334_c0_g1_i1.p1  ORF type:complete len:703 (+),score=104.57 TRINITY_DN14334_c0_g1_i1:58-2109(+)